MVWLFVHIYNLISNSLNWNHITLVHFLSQLVDEGTGTKLEAQNLPTEKFYEAKWATSIATCFAGYNLSLGIVVGVLTLI